MHQIGTLSALGTIAGYQNKGFWHYLAEYFSLFRIGSAHHSPHIAVGAFLRHALFSPLRNISANHLIQRPVCISSRCFLTRLPHQAVLQFPAAGIGSLHQHKNSLLFLGAHLQKWLHAVGAKVGIYRYKILTKPA